MAETYLDRGQRLEREVKPYTPGPTVEEVARRAHRGRGAIAKLSSNENPLGPSPRAVAAIRRFASEAHRYPSASADALRSALGKRLRIRPEQIVVGGGSSTLMHAILAAFSTPGGEIISLDPSFALYAELATIHGGVPITVALRDREFTLPLDRLRAVITPRTQAIFLARPNNPTSTLIPLDEFQAVADMANAVGALVISDEAYIEFADGAPSALELLCGREPRAANVLVTRTFSKAFGLASLRVGYAIGTVEAARCLRLANAKWPTSGIAQAAAIAALGDLRQLTRTLTVVRGGRRMLAETLARLGVGVVPNPQGNYVMADVAAVGWTAPAFAEAVFATARVLIRGDFSDRYVRISIGRRQENRRLLTAIRRLVRRRRAGSPA